MALPRKFLNSDEELLAELRPHWIFLFGPLFTSIGTWLVILVIVILWHSAPGWTSYPFLILALIPAVWLLGRFVRWRSYIIALTSTRIFVRQGIFGRDTVQLRLQRITELNVSQSFIERILGVGRIIIDVQGEDDSMVLEYVRKPTVVQRVLNSQVNEILGAGEREPIPLDMLPFDQRGGARRAAQQEHDDDIDRHDTPPFGQGAVRDDDTEPGRTAPAPAPAPAPTPTSTPAPDQPTSTTRSTPSQPFEIRDRLIELDDLRKRGIISEEEFAAKKSELLNRI